MQYRSSFALVAKVRRWWWVVAVLLIGSGMIIGRPATVAAHPLGNFTVNRYSRLLVSPGHLAVQYVLDMAEIPAFQERMRIDADQDGTISTHEQQTYLLAQTEALRQNLRLLADGQPITLHTDSTHLEFPTGQGGLLTLRLSARFVADLPTATYEAQLSYADGNYGSRLGWSEIVVQAADGSTLLASSVPSQDISQELRAYPTDLLQNPLTVSQAEFRVAPGVAGAGPLAQQQMAVQAAPAAAPAADQFAALITRPVDTPLAVVLVLLVAFGLGALHALSPGHGKTIVAAYLVGSRSSTWHALLLGLTTTATHTAGVFALGLITLGVSTWVLPEQLYPFLSLVSGLLVVLLGITLLRLRSAALHHPHDHSHDHPHDHSHHHPFGLHHHHHHDHHHHHHTLPGEGGPTTVRSLLLLGISGGLLPCPSALVVLLSAIALGRVGFGLLLVVAFSLGLASVLTAIGLLLVHARRWFTALPVQRHKHVLKLLPIGSAAIVTLLGVGMVVQALSQAGLLRL